MYDYTHPIFGNPAYLKTKDEQLVLEMQEGGEVKSAPIENIGILILDHQQIMLHRSCLGSNTEHLFVNNIK